MAKVISQETFDDVVQENVVEFSMSPDEAKQETIKQFEAQGVSLTNIIKDLAINEDSGRPVLTESTERLKALLEDKVAQADPATLLKYLAVLDEECQKSLPHRILAAKLGAHETLVTLLEVFAGTQASHLEVVTKCLQAVINLTNKQPDIFTAKALDVAIKLLAHGNEETRCLTLQWLQKACVMHEHNRQNIFNGGILKALKPLVSKESPQVLRDVLGVFRHLVLDDDIRVEFGCAHEHARQIATEVITDLTKLLTEIEDPAILADLLLTIGALAVRQEFCKSIEEADGIKSIFNIMTSNLEAQRLNREALKLLRALAGNDSVKVHIIEEGAAPIIKNVLEAHISNENLVVAALACISTLTLRVKHNSSSFFETGIAETIAEALRLHPKHKVVQRNGAWAIRNMVSRSRDQCPTWLSFGVEELLNAAMQDHPTVQQDIKAALRDLGCDVELKEEWTGTAEKKITNKQ